MIDDQVIFEMTGCKRADIPTEKLVGGAKPGLTLTSRGNELLCEAEQSYLDGNAHPTGQPEDYVLVTISR